MVIAHFPQTRISQTKANVTIELNILKVTKKIIINKLLKEYRRIILFIWVIVRKLRNRNPVSFVLRY